MRLKYNSETQVREHLFSGSSKKEKKMISTPVGAHFIPTAYNEVMAGCCSAVVKQVGSRVRLPGFNSSFNVYRL